MAFDLGGILSAGTGAGGFNMPSGATGALSDRSPINVAPVGVNLGAILQPVSQGSPENGGIGADYFSRYSGAGYANLSASEMGSKNMLPWILAGGAALLALFFLVR